MFTNHRLIAAILLGIWIALIVSPLASASQAHYCQVCHHNMCLMVHKNQPEPSEPSCHQHAAPQKCSLTAGACPREIDPILFTYDGILPDPDGETGTNSAKMPVDSFLNAPVAELKRDTPPPRSV